MIEIKGTLQELESVLIAIKKSNWCIFGLTCERFTNCFDCLWKNIDWKVTDDDNLQSVLEDYRKEKHDNV